MEISLTAYDIEKMEKTIKFLQETHDLRDLCLICSLVLSPIFEQENPEELFSTLS